VVNLYLDEDINILLATLLRARNINVITTLESNMLGSEDDDQLDYSTSKISAIVTHNRVHFENLYGKYIDLNKTHSGIIILIRRDVYLMAKKLSRFAITHDDISNQLWYV
jgi:hypothetical protein